MIVIRLLVIVIGLASLWTGPAQGDVRALRIMGDGVASRLVIEADDPIAHEDYLDADGAYRLVLDLPGQAWSDPDVVRTGPSGVTAYEWRDGALAVTLDQPMMVARTLDLPPVGEAEFHRLVVDLARVSEARFESVARSDARRRNRAKEALARAEAERRKALAEARRYVVVVDPGHGGRHPGAVSPSGAVEKEINLEAALILRDLLKQDARFDVRLTRDDDSYVGLAERVSLARSWDADLFISLHADAAGSPDVSGASVYTLSAKGERRADQARIENDWDLPIETEAPREVADILEDLLRRETKTNSGRLAALLIPELAKSGPVLRNTHRDAGFVVLFAPDVPAVLLEMGFLTNAADARRLRSTAGQRAAMEAVARAISAYFNDRDLMLAGN